MDITVIGSGYVGLVTASCLAELGNNVMCVDIDNKKIKALNHGRIPIYEPGLDVMIQKNIAMKRLKFSGNIRDSVNHGDLQFIAVGTPSSEDGSADLSYVIDAAKNIGRYMSSYKVIVNKSTVPVGTADKVTEVISRELIKRKSVFDFSVVSNPEFLKEGAAIEDFMHPDRIIIGTHHDDGGEIAKALMNKLYAPLNKHHNRICCMDIRSAELSKYAANAMLATRISFMNEMANLADQLGADIESVRLGIGSDSRIGYSFLYPGIGYGGSCFPKDVKALIKTADDFNSPLKILKAVDSVNQMQKLIIFEKICAVYGRNLTGKTFAIWGLSFKPNTDDMREAPSRFIIKELIQSGAIVKVFDPIALEEAKYFLKVDCVENKLDYQKIVFETSMQSTLCDSNALLILTEWKEFKSPNFNYIKEKLIDGVIFDGRNIYDPDEVKSFGIRYFGIGRSTQK